MVRGRSQQKQMVRTYLRESQPSSLAKLAEAKLLGKGSISGPSGGFQHQLYKLRVSVPDVRTDNMTSLECG